MSETEISSAFIELDDSVSDLLRGFSSVSQEVSEALRRESNDGRRLALIAVEDRLDDLLRELESSDKLCAYRFRSLLTQWRQIVAEKAQELAVAVERRQETDGITP
jgi:hypothetical protein